MSIDSWRAFSEAQTKRALIPSTEYYSEFFLKNKTRLNTDAAASSGLVENDYFVQITSACQLFYRKQLDENARQVRCTPLLFRLIIFRLAKNLHAFLKLCFLL